MSKKASDLIFYRYSIISANFHFGKILHFKYLSNMIAFQCLFVTDSFSLGRLIISTHRLNVNEYLFYDINIKRFML